MIRTIYLFLLGIGLLQACHDGEKTSTDADDYSMPQGMDTMDSNEPFYPFIDYLKGQVLYVDSTPVGIEKTVHINDRLIDSGFISKESFKNMVSFFLQDNPEAPALKPFYKEVSFNDLSINRLTFSIAAISDSLPLLQADILLNPENQSVKNVVMRRQNNNPDSTVMMHLIWVHNMHFQISEMISKNNGTSYKRVTRVVWDKPLE